MSDTRKKDANWRLNVDNNGRVSNDDAQLAVLMDIRDELKRLNSLLHCQNFQAIPRILKRVSANTYERKHNRKQ